MPKENVKILVHMRDPRSTWGVSKRQKCEAEQKAPKAETAYEDRLLKICRLIAGHSSGAIGKLERVWDQKGVDKWRETARFEVSEAMLLRQDVDKSYDKFLTPEGYSIINQALTMISQCNKQGVWTLADVLDSDLFWNDFVGLACKVHTLNTQGSLGGAGRYFTGVSYVLVRGSLQKDIQQHLRAFQMAKRVSGGWKAAAI